MTLHYDWKETLWHHAARQRPPPPPRPAAHSEPASLLLMHAILVPCSGLYLCGSLCREGSPTNHLLVNFFVTRSLLKCNPFREDILDYSIEGTTRILVSPLSWDIPTLFSSQTYHYIKLNYAYIHSVFYLRQEHKLYESKVVFVHCCTHSTYNISWHIVALKYLLITSAAVTLSPISVSYCWWNQCHI